MDSCVEVPVVASQQGFEPIRVCPLPRQLAILNSINASCDDLAVEGFIASDSEKVCQALAFDPLTSAVLSLDEIKQMTNEMLEAAKEWLPEYRKLQFFAEQQKRNLTNRFLSAALFPSAIELTIN